MKALTQTSRPPSKKAECSNIDEEKCCHFDGQCISVPYGSSPPDLDCSSFGCCSRMSNSCGFDKSWELCQKYHKGTTVRSHNQMTWH